MWLVAMLAGRHIVQFAHLNCAMTLCGFIGYLSSRTELVEISLCLRALKDVICMCLTIFIFFKLTCIFLLLLFLPNPQNNVTSSV